MLFSFCIFAYLPSLLYYHTLFHSGLNFLIARTVSISGLPHTLYHHLQSFYDECSPSHSPSLTRSHPRIPARNDLLENRFCTIDW